MLPLHWGKIADMTISREQLVRRQTLLCSSDLYRGGHDLGSCWGRDLLGCVKVVVILGLITLGWL